MQAPSYLESEMKTDKTSIVLPVVACLLLSSYPATGSDTDLTQRLNELERRVLKLEQSLEEQNADSRWKDPVLWRRISIGMSEAEIRKLLGTPARIEKAVFTTWYYHPTSKLHSHVWFDEGKVLGWQGTEPKHQRRPSLLK
jgi:hypothetical protein